MEFLSFQTQKDIDKVRELLKSLINSKHLIPVLGSGFTHSTDTARGRIPSTQQLREKIIELLLKTDEYKGKDEEDFEKIVFSELADFFWQYIDSDQKICREFRDYIEENFTHVRDLSPIKRRFLNSGWRYIYTLNYDDAIENVLEINCIIPYRKQSAEFIDQHRCLFKLHGDAGIFLQTGDKKYFIMGHKQYMDSMMSSENYDMCRHLESDFSANSLLFIGCSLEDELDLLFAAEYGLNAKTSLNQEDAKLVYVRYYSDGSQPSVLEQVKYQNYGISHIITIRDDNEADFLYKMIREFYEQREQIEEEEELEKYRGVHIKQLKKEDEKNLDYFFRKDCVDAKNGEIVLPGFFIERAQGDKLLEELNESNFIYVLTGAKFSGKTYVLLQLLRKLPPERTYYLPITVNDEILDKMMEKKNCYFLLDKQALKINQIKKIFKQSRQLEKNNIKMILTVDADDKEFFEFYIQQSNDLWTGIKFYDLKNRFEKNDKKDECKIDEISRFNKCVGKIRLVNYKERDTLLDYIFRVDENLIGKKKRILPKVCSLGDTDIDKLKAMIVLAVKEVIPLSMANWLGITDTLIAISNEYPMTVQKDYLSDIEAMVDYSRYKFVNNSPYWVIKCLAKCAGRKINHKAIAEAFYSLTCAFSKRYKNEIRFNNEFKEYYKLTTLQTLFSNPNEKGTIQIPYTIYERLHGKLCDNYQFLHQEAKCELRLARREKETEKCMKIIQKAFSNITRAIDLANEVSAENIEYSLNHMLVTKALILSNYFLLGEKYDLLEETVKVYHETFIEQAALLEEDFLKRDDLKDVKEFLNRILIKGKDIGLSEEGKYRFSDIYYKRFGKRVYIE